MEARLRQDSCREKLRRKSHEPRKLDLQLLFGQAYDSSVMAYELVTGPENCPRRCGTLRHLRFGHICAKAAAHKGEAPESELSYGGNRLTDDYTF
jgi:hypothetical protein